MSTSEGAGAGHGPQEGSEAPLPEESRVPANQGMPERQPMDEARWDTALHWAFASTDGVSRLSLKTGRPGIALPTDPTQPLLKPGLVDWSAADTGRYRVLGEIDRGAVGSVLLAHDADLGRDVAVKVMHTEHIEDPELFQRFVEEAQIVGQLQHPGLVPVHELGLDLRGRPYFTMQVVRGRPFSELLKERSAPSGERARFLALFTQVCATMAFVHLRGVVHRDLKPANVLVGPLGEVFVTDFGFAKVMPQGAVGLDPGTGSTAGTMDEASSPAERSPVAMAQPAPEVTTARSRADLRTLTGAVFGTPAYMAPEQARGIADQVDQRTDVFALGAVLCEILTGAPPYGGAQALHAAASAALREALDRLSNSDADPVLVALARRCLAADPTARPADAGAVHRAMVEWRDGVESRIRSAELAAVAASARGAEERKARRLTLALAVAALAVVLGATAVLLARRAHGERLEREIRMALEEATTRLAVGSDDALQVAEAAVQRARSLAATGAPSTDVLQAIQVRSDQVAEGRLRRDLLVHAHQLRLAPPEDVDGVERALGELFGRHGLGLDQEPESFAAVVTSLDPELEQAVLRSVQDLAYRLRRIPGRGVDVARLFHIADRLDPDLQRTRIRRAMMFEVRGFATVADRDGARAEMQRLGEQWSLPVEGSHEPEGATGTGEAGEALVPAGSYWLLALALQGVPSNLPLATRLVERAVELHPDDFDLRFRLVRLLMVAEPSRLPEARQHARIAFLLRPDPGLRLLALEGPLRRSEARMEAGFEGGRSQGQRGPPPGRGRPR